MEKSKFEDLLQKYLSGTASEGEKQQLIAWYNSFDDEKVIVKAQSVNEEQEVYERLRMKMDEILNAPAKEAKIISIKRNYVFWKIAAAMIILFCGYWGWKGYQSHQDNNQVESAIHKLHAGHSGAILTLADGKQIFLDSAQNGTISTSGNNHIIKKGAQVIYGSETVDENAPLTYNTMATPKGREFQIVLPDGTKVWLNAASSIKYPTVFNAGLREVEVTGEAYFEVAHQADKKGARIPFIVHTNRMTIRVLGTHFDVNAYEDEPYTKTTLLEGSVAANEKGSNKIETIKPGQQAIVSNTVAGEIKVQPADVDKAVAWKNGLFQFNDDQLEAILRQVSRWYDIDIDCAAGKKDLRFNGVISRRSNVKAIMDLLSATGVVNFKIKNGKLNAY
jgi:ferric-dicitrate binding protein FerR (iron transport regulator)